MQGTSKTCREVTRQKKIIKKIKKKNNPAYGRHRISRPMLKEAPIQKKTYKDFSSSSGFWLRGVGCCALYSRTLVYIFIHWITLHFFPMQCTSLKCFRNICSFNAQQFNSMCSAVQWHAIQCSIGQCSEVQCMTEPCSLVKVKEV